MPRSTSQYGRIHAALKMLKLGKEQKEDMVYSYTGDAAKVSLKDLDFDQASDLIGKLNEMVSPSTAQASPADADKAACNKIRRSILAVCHNLKWYRKDENDVLILKNGKPQLDYVRIDDFCLMRIASHKRLNDMTKEELQTARYQFDQTYKNYLTQTPKTK